MAVVAPKAFGEEAGVSDRGYSKVQLSFLGGARGLGAAVAARELFYASGCVDELLLAGEEGMAVRANADFDVPPGRPCMVNRAASARDFGLRILGMNVGFHVRERARNVCARGRFRKR